TIVRETQREKERLHHEINEKSQEIHRLNIQNVHLSQGIKEEETRLEKELEIMQKQVDELQNTNKRLKEQMALFDTRIAHIRRDLNAKDGLIEQMRNQRNQIFKVSANLLSYINSELLPQLSPEVQKKIEFNVSEFSNVLHSVAPLKYRVLFHIVSKKEKSTVAELAQKLNEDKKTVRAITEELQARQWINKSDELVYPVGEEKPGPIPPHEWTHLKPIEILDSLADYSKAVADHSKVSQAILKVRNLIVFHPSLSLTLRREALAWAQGKGDIFRLNNLIQQWKQEFLEVEEETIEEEVPKSMIEEEREEKVVQELKVEDEELEEEIPAPVLEDKTTEEETKEKTNEDEDNGE
ncbi:MAG: hypothetical protein ACFFCQ_14460, partial [Promethearchaeota archaeon]